MKRLSEVLFLTRGLFYRDKFTPRKRIYGDANGGHLLRLQLTLLGYSQSVESAGGANGI